MNQWVLATTIDIGKKMMENPIVSGVVASFLFFVSGIYGEGEIVRAGMTVIVILIIMDWITGTSAAKKSGTDTSQYGIEGMKRSIVVLLIPALAHFLDGFLYTQGLAVYFTIAALARSITRSIIANLYRANWTQWIPVDLMDTLINWVEDEILQKEARSKKRQEEMGINERERERVRQS